MRSGVLRRPRASRMSFCNRKFGCLQGCTGRSIRAADRIGHGQVGSAMQAMRAAHIAFQSPGWLTEVTSRPRGSKYSRSRRARAGLKCCAGRADRACRHSVAELSSRSATAYIARKRVRSAAQSARIATVSSQAPAGCLRCCAGHADRISAAQRRLTSASNFVAKSPQALNPDSCALELWASVMHEFWNFVMKAKEA